MTKATVSLPFTDEQVLFLRNEFRKNPFSIRGKARELEIKNHIYVSWALSGKTYSHLPDPIDPTTFLKGGNTRPCVWKLKPRVNKPKAAKIEKITPPTPIPKPVIKPEIKTVNKEDRLKLIRDAAKKLKL